MTHLLRLKSLRASVYRAPIETPVTTSFGIMRDRPMVLVTAEDHDGARGWGEIWCNFPQVGAEHRARLVESVLTPLATAGPFDGPEALFRHLTAATEVLAIQCGEAGDRLRRGTRHRQSRGHAPRARAVSGRDGRCQSGLAARRGD
jgi:D-galactarolactone cycloisomerase